VDKQNKTIIISVIILILAVIALAFIKISESQQISYNYDTFAQCLTEKGAVMYGAKWCSHCKAQKAMFGDSFKYIKYVECPDEKNIQICLENDVQGYPTWIIGTSTKLEGEVSFEKLSEVSGCSLPVNK